MHRAGALPDNAGHTRAAAHAEPLYSAYSAERQYPHPRQRTRKARCSTHHCRLLAKLGKALRYLAPGFNILIT